MLFYAFSLHLWRQPKALESRLPNIVKEKVYLETSAYKCPSLGQPQKHSC